MIDHRAAIRTVMEELAVIREETIVEIDHRAASRTVTETRAVSAPVSEKIRTEIIQTEMAAETAAVLLAAEITVHLL